MPKFQIIKARVREVHDPKARPVHSCVQSSYKILLTPHYRCIFTVTKVTPSPSCTPIASAQSKMTLTRMQCFDREPNLPHQDIY
jgi:hypothetical protein